MFNNLASYLLGLTSQDSAAAAEPARRTDVRLTAVIADEDDWVLVDRDSEGDTDVASSLESIPEAHECETQQALYQAATTLLTRTSSTSSLPCTNIEESWFLTPPPCFTSAGPIHMETSPLENLLIEHPSMSVYQHSSQSALAVAVAAARRHSSAPSSPSAASSVLDDYDEDMYSEAIAERLEDRGTAIALPQPRRVPVNAIKQQERQCVQIKNAQKLQIQKACQSLKRGYIERNNKAREVNCRNHRQRRGERSQGSARSNANNNRKC